jgi:hypothetical protein
VGGDDPSYTTPATIAEDNGSRYYCVVSIAEPAGIDATATSREAYLVIKRRIAYWPFEGTLENLDDPSGNSDGTPQGAPLFSEEGIVNAGQALQLNGSSDYVTVDNDALAWSPSGSFSVSLWAYVAGGTAHRAAISNRHDPADLGYPRYGFILYAQPNNLWSFWTGAGSSGWGGATGGAVVVGEWAHIVIAFHPTGTSGDFLAGTSTLYLNGMVAAQSENDLYWPKLPDQSDLFIGAGQNENPANFYFNGLIDDVRVYNYAMELDEVRLQYTDVVGPACLFGNPIGDLTGPDGNPDCLVDLLDLALIAEHWLDHGFFPDRP